MVKTCPKCGEEVKKTSVICAYCRTSFYNRYIAGFILITLALLLTYYFLQS